MVVEVVEVVGFGGCGGGCVLGKLVMVVKMVGDDGDGKVVAWWVNGGDWVMMEVVMG